MGGRGMPTVEGCALSVPPAQHSPWVIIIDGMRIHTARFAADIFSPLFLRNLTVVRSQVSHDRWCLCTFACRVGCFGSNCIKMPLVGNSTLGYSTKAAAASDLRKMGNRFFAAGAALAVGSVDALFDDGGLEGDGLVTKDTKRCTPLATAAKGLAEIASLPRSVAMPPLHFACRHWQPREWFHQHPHSAMMTVSVVGTCLPLMYTRQ